MTSAPTITVASYNMRKAIGTDRRRDPGRVLAVLKEIDADVVALQEADKRFGGRGSAVPHELIDSHGLYKPVPVQVRHKRVMDRMPGGKQVDKFLKIDTRNIGWHGNALLVKPHVGILDVAALDLPTLEPRGAILAELLIGDWPVRIVGMHLDLSGLWRRRQAHAILAHLESRPGDPPAVLMGDLNEWSAHGGCLRDFGHHLRFADCGRSFHVRRAVVRLDRIMVNRGLKIVESGVHRSPTARKASDHWPIWATLKT